MKLLVEQRVQTRRLLREKPNIDHKIYIYLMVQWNKV